MNASFLHYAYTYVRKTFHSLLVTAALSLSPRCSDEDYRKELIEMCCRQDPGRISATFATLMPSTPAPQLMPSSHLTNDTDNMLFAAAGDGCHVHSANSTSTQLSSQIGASVQHPFPDFQGDSVDSAGRPGRCHSEANSQKDGVRGCVDGAREETNLKGHLRPIARDQCWSTAHSGSRQTGPSNTTLMCRHVQEARIERKEGGGSHCTIVERRDIAGDPSLLLNAVGVQSSMLPIESTLNSMVYDDEATFKCKQCSSFCFLSFSYREVLVLVLKMCLCFWILF